MTRSRTPISRFLSAAVVLLALLAGAPYAAAQKIPITTRSNEALKLFQEGRDKLQNFHREEAHQLFGQAIAKDPDFVLALLLFAESASDPKVLEEGIRKALVLAPRVSKVEQLMIAADQAWFLENDRVKGTEFMRQIAEMYPNDPEPQTWLGMSYNVLGETDKAIEVFHKALALDKDFIVAHYTLAYAYLAKGEYGKAEEHFKVYQRLQPKEANPHDCLGDVYMKMGRFDEAIGHYSQAVALDPHFALSQSKTGSCYVFKGNYEEGRRAFEKAKTMEVAAPYKAADEEGIVRSYIYAGEFKKALEAADAAIRLSRELGLPGEAALLHLGKCAIQCELKNYAAAAMSIVECRKCLADPAAPADAKQNTGVMASFWEVFAATERKDLARAETKLAGLKAAIAKTNEPFLSMYADAAPAFILLAKGDHAGSDAQFAKVKGPDPFFMYYAAVAKEKAGDATGAKALYAKVANWNEDTLWYAFVRNKSKARL